MDKLNDVVMERDMQRLKTMIIVFRNRLVLAYHYRDPNDIDNVNRYYEKVLDRFSDLEESLSEVDLSNRYCRQLIAWRNYLSKVILKMRSRYGKELLCK